jgi:hypothetical protein
MMRRNELLTRLAAISGDEERARRGDGERGELDRWAKHYGLKRHGYDLPDDWRCGTPERIEHWEKARESDEDLKERVAVEIRKAHS